MTVELDYDRCLNPWVTSLNKPNLHKDTIIELRTGSGKIFGGGFPSNTLTPADWKRYDIYEYRVFKV